METVAPLRARPYDPTTDVDVGSGGEELAPTPEPESSSSSSRSNRVQTEFVDVYLLAPEEDRAIELKDFTIMKPKNNKMHRLVRYFPRCEIAYTAAPPPEEKLVISPRGTTTTAHRHNGGFSNPSRNTEVFRLKRQLLSEYLASTHENDASGAAATMHDTGNDSYSHPFASGGFHPNSTLQRAYRRPMSPASVSSDAQMPAPPPLPKYTPAPVGDEESIPLTSERATPMSLKARVQYIDSLWPGVAPVDDEDDVMDYYGIEVFIVSEEEREKELKATAAASEGAAQSSSSPEKKPEPAAAVAVASPEKPSGTSAAAVVSPQKSEADDENEPPEMTVETRSSALQKLKDAEMKVLPVASKQDDWVQCDKCQKWRRLPNHVNVSELPASWYCKMNRWDKRFNKCSSPEEKIAVLMKESDLLEYRERKFALDFLQRVKRMEKALLQYKYSDPRDDDGERKYVQCVECLKKRPLLGGMDPSKIPQPFVCWMNWDELRASCSAPQGALSSRDFDLLNGVAAANGAAGDEPGDKSSKKSGSKTGHVFKHASESSAKHDAGVASGGASSKKPSKGGAGAGSSSNNNTKRKPAPQGSGSAAEKSSGGATANTKKPKRR